MCGFVKSLPLLAYMSKVESGVHGLPPASRHRSGMVNGFTHVSAFAGDASPTAIAVMFTVGTPKIGPISVGTALDRAATRYTCTRTRLGWPDASFRNVTSAAPTDGADPITALARAALTALWTTGPPAE